MSNTNFRHYGYVPEKQLSFSTFNGTFGSGAITDGPYGSVPGSRTYSSLDGWRPLDRDSFIETKSFNDLLWHRSQLS